MANQPRYEPLQPSTAFEDGMSSRPPVPGTIARGKLQLRDAFYSGMENGKLVTSLPQQALAGKTMMQLLARGRERYSIVCANCHGIIGGGTGGDKAYESLVGMVVLRGFPTPPTYHQQRLREAPIGHFFDVMTRGFGRMPAHGYMISPQDRWAIAAYVRALQLSQHAPVDDVPDEVRHQLDVKTASIH
jgi:mono/diheme cytochrome c family protein